LKIDWILEDNGGIEMKIKVKKEYNDMFEAINDIGDKIFKDGELDLKPLLESGTEIEFDLTGYVEFEVLVKDEDVSLNKNKEKKK
jgi:hypothetical protein